MTVEEEQLLPIDISYYKLADYLVDRRKLPGDWRKRIAQVRGRISAALLRLPKDADPWFGTLTSECAGYLEALKVRDILSKTMPEERTMFGRLSGIAGEWDSIVRAYEKDSIFLGEAAQIMVQNVNYEIPSHKKHIAKLQQQLTDLERKEVELKRSIVTSASRYSQACQELGITGANVRAELVAATVSALPKVFSEVIDILCGELVGESTELYSAFSSYAHEVNDSSLVVTLKEVRNNPSAFSVVEIDEQPGKTEDASRVDNKEDIIEPVVEKEIQWDITTPDEQDDKSSEIQWDIDLSSTIVEEAEQEGDASEIVWDIDVDDGGKVDELRESNAAGFKSDAQVTLPCTGLADLTFRNELLNDLVELKMFLIQRIQEMESSVLQHQMQAAALQQHGAAALREMVVKLDRAVGLLTNTRTRTMLTILSSRSFLDRLEASLQHKKQNEVKSVESLKDLERRRVELRNAVSSTWPKQEAVASRTRELKAYVEKALSLQYQGRRVNLIGEINNVV